MILSPAFKKIKRVAGGWEQIINRIPATLCLPEGRDPGHHGGLQGVRSVMVGPIEDPFTISMSSGGCRGALIINRIHITP